MEPDLRRVAKSSKRTILVVVPLRKGQRVQGWPM